MKHRATETWEQRADRCIRELQGPAECAGQHRADTVYLSITPNIAPFIQAMNRVTEAFARLTQSRAEWLR